MIVLSVSLASNGVVKVPGYEQLVRFGYTKNRGVYRLAVAATGEWEGLTIRAFWHVPGGKDPASSLVADGSVDVPASVTVQPGNGCVTFEGSDGAKTVTSADLRYRVAANSGTEDGTTPEPGTPAWQQLVDAVHADATAAEQAKNDAQTAANQAGASAGEAAASAKNAGQSAAEALAWADSAKKSALAAGSNSQNAAQYAGEAKSFAEQAANSSSAAESSASAAAGSQQAAESSAKKSDASANTAQESATRATGSASKAAQAQKNAETAADRAETAQQKTEEVRTDALDKISAAKADALKAVDAKQADATAAVERTQKKVLDAVTAAQDTAVKAVSDAQSTATQAVQTAQTDAVSAVEKAGSEVLESIPEDYQTTVKKVEELKTEKAEIDDTTVGLDAWSSKHIVDMLCPPISETGNPVQCYYPVVGYPLGCKVSWEPTQEGSETPYPAGGGKNLWGDLLQNVFISQLGFSAGYSGAKTTGKIPCTEGDKYTLSCATTFSPAPGNIGVLACFDESDTMLTRVANTYNRAFTLTAPANVAYLRASCLSTTDADNVQLEKGADATAYAPYENIRPIKGRDSVTVERCGKNLWSLGNVGFKQYKEISTNYPAGKYVLSYEVETESTDDTAQVGWFADGKWAYLQTQKNKRIKILISASVGISGFRFYGGSSPADHSDAIYKNIQLELGNDATIYTPYTGQTAAITLPETIYGGTVDAVTGEGQETWKLLTLDGTENYVEDAPKQYSISLKEVSYSGKCSHFKSITLDELRSHVVGAYMKYTGKVIFNTNFSSLDEFKHYLRAQFEAGTPIQICYTRIPNVPNPTFTATGAQPIPALSGVNTVLTDADSATVTGRADPIKRITDLEDAVASMTNT